MPHIFEGSDCIHYLEFFCIKGLYLLFHFLSYITIDS